jgi:hypothetical protein
VLAIALRTTCNQNISEFHCIYRKIDAFLNVFRTGRERRHTEQRARLRAPHLLRHK